MSAGNNLTVVGNAVRDPELKFTPSGMAVATFGVAVNRKWQNRETNEWQEETSFIDVTAWAGLAENVSKSVAKGMRVVVAGRLDQRTWETQDGDKRSKVEIVADEVSPSLKYATAVVTKNERGDSAAGNGSRGNGSARASGNGRSATAVQEAPAYDQDEEPFIVPAGEWWPDAGLGSAPRRMLP